VGARLIRGQVAWRYTRPRPHHQMAGHAVGIVAMPSLRLPIEVDSPVATIKNVVANSPARGSRGAWHGLHHSDTSTDGQEKPECPLFRPAWQHWSTFRPLLGAFLILPALPVVADCPNILFARIKRLDVLHHLHNATNNRDISVCVGDDVWSTHIA
jgi:hypothetical protein